MEIFPNPAAFLRLATAVVVEAHHELQVTRRYLMEISMAELRKVIAAKQSTDKPLAEQRQIAVHSARLADRHRQPYDLPGGASSARAPSQLRDVVVVMCEVPGHA